MANVAGVTVSITAETARFVAGLKKSKREANKFARDVKRSLVPLAAIGTLVATLGRQVLQTTSELGKFSRIVGLSAESVQELRFAAGQLDVSQRGVDDSLRHFNRRLGEFVNSGGGPAAKAFQTLGINVRDTEGNLRGTEPILNEVIDKIAELGSSARQGAFAAQLFGDDFGPKLVPLLQQGTRGIERLRKQARDLGLVLSTDVVKGAEDANDKLGVLSEVIRANFTKAIVEQADAWGALAQGLTEVIGAAGRFTANTGRGIGIFLAQLSGAGDPTNPLLEQASLQDQLNRRIKERAQLQSKLGRGPGDAGIFGGNEDKRADARRRLGNLDSEIRALRAGIQALANPGRNDLGLSGGGGGGGDPKQRIVDAIVPGEKELRTSFNEFTPKLKKNFEEAFDAALFSGKDSNLTRPEALFRPIIEASKTVFEPLKREAELASRFLASAVVDKFAGDFQGGFDDIVKSFVRMIARMVLEAQALKFFNFIGGGVASLFGGGRPAGGRATGGNVFPGQSVVTHGTEIVTAGATPLRVTPLNGLGGLTINSPIDARGSSAELIRRLIPLLDERDDMLEARITERMRGVG